MPRAVTDIATAELVVVDGMNATKIPLTAENLLAGTLAYVRRTGKVDITLRTRTRRNELYEAVAHYLGPAPEPPVIAESKPPASAEVDRMKAEMERLNSELERMRAIPVKPPEVNAKSRTPEARPMPAQAPVSQRSAQPASAVPANSCPSLNLATQTSAPSSPQGQAPSLPPPKPTPAQPAAAHPASGRAIWTGSLPWGGVLLLRWPPSECRSGNRANAATAEPHPCLFGGSDGFRNCRIYECEQRTHRAAKSGEWLEPDGVPAGYEAVSRYYGHGVSRAIEWMAAPHFAKRAADIVHACARLG